MFEQESDILVAEPEYDVEEFSSSKQDYEDSVESKPSVDQNQTIKKEADAFVNYKFNNLNKVYKKYDVVKTYVPKKQSKQNKKNNFESYINERSSYVPEKETFVIERTKEKQQGTLSSKAKAWLVSVIMIITLLTGLSIYNAIHINNISDQVAQTEININNVNEDIKKSIKSLSEITDEAEVKRAANEMGLEEISEENKVIIELEEKNQIVDYESQTNFFDKICNFFRNLFGG